MRIQLACALGILVLQAPVAVAYAFCRTTTVREPVPYNPVASGCWRHGHDLGWPGGQRIPYWIAATPGQHITPAQAERVADLAFEAWNQVDCGGARPNVQAYDSGLLDADAAAGDCGLRPCGRAVHDARHVITFDDKVWPHDDPNNTLALTTVTYGVDSGDIFDADIEINTAGHTIVAEEPPPPGAYDLQAILTHEAGHFFGLAHATSTSPVMYAQYKPGAITLTTDDMEGMCSVYEPTPTHGCACSLARGRSGGMATLPEASLAGLLVACVRRKRSPRRVASAPGPARGRRSPASLRMARPGRV